MLHYFLRVPSPCSKRRPTRPNRNCFRPSAHSSACLSLAFPATCLLLHSFCRPLSRRQILAHAVSSPLVGPRGGAGLESTHVLPRVSPTPSGSYNIAPPIEPCCRRPPPRPLRPKHLKTRFLAWHCTARTTAFATLCAAGGPWDPACKGNPGDLPNRIPVGPLLRSSSRSGGRPALTRRRDHSTILGYGGMQWLVDGCGIGSNALVKTTRQLTRQRDTHRGENVVRHRTLRHALNNTTHSHVTIAKTHTMDSTPTAVGACPHAPLRPRRSPVLICSRSSQTNRAPFGSCGIVPTAARSCATSSFIPG